MFNQNEAYLCLSAMVRAREPKLLTREKQDRMLDASSFEEAAKLLTDAGYEDMSAMNQKEIEKSINGFRDSVLAELERLAPDADVVRLFKVKYDYHNAKVIIKSEAQGIESDGLLSDAGRIEGKKLENLYQEEKYSSLPGKLGSAMEKAKTVLARSFNPQQSDFVLDRAYFAELSEIAEESGNAFLKGYVKMLIDATNLKSAVRTLRMGKSSDFMKEALIPGGNTDIDRIANASDKEAVNALFAHTKLEKAAAAGTEALEGGSLTAFEKECDNAVNEFVKNAKLVSFGPEAVAAYVAAFESEITAVRMILTAKKAGISGDSIKERLRDTYA